MSFINSNMSVANNNNGPKPAGTFRTSWAAVRASTGSLNTSNPIREIIETMNLAENPNKKVIPLSIGDPTIFGNLKPCKEILEAIVEANESGKFYGYQTAAGMESARRAVAAYHKRCTGNEVKYQDVILASGCSHAIDLSICVLADQGQNILIPRPGFPLYKTLCSIYGCHYKQYDLLADKNWSIDLEQLESLIDEKTAAIVINNPSNPCGSVFSEQHLLDILDLAERYKLPIISDEIYDKFVFSKQHVAVNNSGEQLGVKRPGSLGRSAKTIGEDRDENVDDGTVTNENSYANNNTRTTICELIDNSLTAYTPFISISSLSKTVPVLTCGGISKTCLIPGLRLGWIIVNDPTGVFASSVRNGLNRLTQRLMGPNSLVQGALEAILTRTPDSYYKQTMEFIYKNAKLAYDRMRTIRGLQPYMPQGSMYLMVRFDPKCFPNIESDLDFTSKLMNEESVLVLPGKCFDFPDYFRVCLTVPANVMESALDRMRDFCERHYAPPEGSQTLANEIGIVGDDRKTRNHQLAAKSVAAGVACGMKRFLPDHAGTARFQLDTKGA